MCKKSIRILQIIADGRPGGGTTHIIQLLNGLQRRYACELVGQSNSYLVEEGQKLGIPTHEINFSVCRVDLSALIQLRRLCLSLHPDIVHVHGGRAGFFYALSRLKFPLIYTVHGWHFEGKKPPARWLARKAESLVMQQAKACIFVSQFDANLGKKEGLLPEGKDHRVIHNGINVQGISNSEMVTTKSIGFVGRLEYQKDPMLFLDLMECLPECRGTIVGSGSLGIRMKEEIVRRNLGERVQIVDGVSHKDALKIMQTFQVLVVTSRWEGLPFVILEAMASRVPVVSLNVSGIGEIIEDGVHGVLIEKRSGRALAAGVSKIQEDAEFREKIVTHALARIEKKFLESSMVRSIEDMYDLVAMRVVK